MNAGTHAEDLVRFWTRVIKSEGCWEWDTKPPSARYGQFGAGGQTWKPHRYSYTVNVGPIPDGLWVLHHCDNGFCVRPDHLFLGTYLDNIADMMAKGRHRSGRAHPSHCKYGHPFSGDNLYIKPNGKRQCRTCARRASREWHAAKRAELAA